MRLGIPLGTWKLILQISPDIALVPGLGAHQMRIPLEVEGDTLPENSPVSFVGTLWLDGIGPSYLAAWTTEEQLALRGFRSPNKFVTC